MALVLLAIIVSVSGQDDNTNETDSAPPDATLVPMPPSGCTPPAGVSMALWGNGRCDGGLNTDPCQWDGGDCCQQSCQPGNATSASAQPYLNCPEDAFDCRDPALMDATATTEGATDSRGPNSAPPAIGGVLAFLFCCLGSCWFVRRYKCMCTHRGNAVRLEVYHPPPHVRQVSAPHVSGGAGPRQLHAHVENVAVIEDAEHADSNEAAAAADKKVVVDMPVLASVGSAPPPPHSDHYVIPIAGATKASAPDGDAEVDEVKSQQPPMLVPLGGGSSPKGGTAVTGGGSTRIVDGVGTYGRLDSESYGDTETPLNDDDSMVTIGVRAPPKKAEPSMQHRRNARERRMRSRSPEADTRDALLDDYSGDSSQSSSESEDDMDIDESDIDESGILESDYHILWEDTQEAAARVSKDRKAAADGNGDSDSDVGNYAEDPAIVDEVLNQKGNGNAAAKDRPHVCPKCKKKFTRADNLRVHMKEQHEKILSFQCSHCPRRFTRKHNLNEHLLTHTNERPFSCAICGSKFRLNSNLKRHVRTVHEKPVKCSCCKERFATEGDARAHFKEAHGDEPEPKMRRATKTFRCRCKKRFKQYTALDAHVQDCPVAKADAVAAAMAAANAALAKGVASVVAASPSQQQPQPPHQHQHQLPQHHHHQQQQHQLMKLESNSAAFSAASQSMNYHAHNRFSHESMSQSPSPVRGSPPRYHVPTHGDSTSPERSPVYNPPSSSSHYLHHSAHGHAASVSPDRSLPPSPAPSSPRGHSHSTLPQHRQRSSTPPPNALPAPSYSPSPQDTLMSSTNSPMPSSTSLMKMGIHTPTTEASAKLVASLGGGNSMPWQNANARHHPLNPEIGADGLHSIVSANPIEMPLDLPPVGGVGSKRLVSGASHNGLTLDDMISGDSQYMLHGQMSDPTLGSSMSAPSMKAELGGTHPSLLHAMSTVPSLPAMPAVRTIEDELPSENELLLHIRQQREQLLQYERMWLHLRQKVNAQNAAFPSMGSGSPAMSGSSANLNNLTLSSHDITSSGSLMHPLDMPMQQQQHISQQQQYAQAQHGSPEQQQHQQQQGAASDRSRSHSTINNVASPHGSANPSNATSPRGADGPGAGSGALLRLQGSLAASSASTAAAAAAQSSSAVATAGHISPSHGGGVGGTAPPSLSFVSAPSQPQLSPADPQRQRSPIDPTRVKQEPQSEEQTSLWQQRQVVQKRQQARQAILMQQRKRKALLQQQQHQQPVKLAHQPGHHKRDSTDGVVDPFPKIGALPDTFHSGTIDVSANPLLGDRQQTGAPLVFGGQLGD